MVESYLGPAAWRARTQDELDRRVLDRLEVLRVAARGTEDEAVIERAVCVLRAYGPLVAELQELRVRRASWWARLWGVRAEAP